MEAEEIQKAVEAGVDAASLQATEPQAGGMTLRERYRATMFYRKVDRIPKDRARVSSSESVETGAAVGTAELLVRLSRGVRPAEGDSTAMAVQPKRGALVQGDVMSPYWR